MGDMGTVFLVVDAGIFGMMGLGAVIIALARRRPGAGLLRTVRTRFAAWRIPTGYLGDEDALVRDFATASLTTSRPAAVGLGAGLFVVAGLSAGLALWTGSAGLLTLGNGLVFNLFALTGANVGMIVGLALGIQLRRRRMAGAPLYGDLRPRRLADLRPAWIGGVAWGLVALMSVVTLVMGFRISQPISINYLIFERLVVPVNPLTLGAIPLTLAALLTLGEMAQRWLVAAPRLVLTANLALAARMDDLFRVQFITAIRSTVLIAVAFGLSPQMALLLSGVSRSSPDIVALLVVWLGGGVAIVTAMLVNALSAGQPSGRLARDWTPPAAPSEA